MDPLANLLAEMNAFFQARDWDQFHSPKNVAISLSVEAAELLEHFRWTDAPHNLSEVTDEIGDVFISLLHLAHKLNIDPLAAAHAKLLKNDSRYPVSACKGKNLKYTAYQEQE